MFADSQESGGPILWSAKVGSTRPQEKAGKGSSSCRSVAAAPLGEGEGEAKQAALLVPVHVTAGAGEWVQRLVGAWLQSILRK